MTLHMPLPSANKTAYSGFETQRRCHQKKMVLKGIRKRTVSAQNEDYLIQVQSTWHTDRFHL